MKTYISDIIPKLQRFSEKLDNLALLTNQHWVVIDEEQATKNVYIFRPNNELLISQNGRVEKAKWEYLGNNSLLIDRKDDSYLFKHGFLDENILALKIDSKDEYAFLVNETKYGKELNSILSIAEFLNRRYLAQVIRHTVSKSNDSSNALVSYSAPNFILKKISQSSSFWAASTVHLLVEYEDGEKGEVFHRTKNDQAYFKAKFNGSWTTLTHYYENLDFCIDALHFYIKTGKILKNGFIVSQS